MPSSPASSAAAEARRLPAYDDVQEAAERLRGVAVPTPMLEARALNERVRGRLLVKAEPLQITGSFKLRGAYNRISRLGTDKRRRVVAYSSGNHAQGVAAAAHLLGAAATIVMPTDAPEIKVVGTRSWGAEIVFYDRHGEDRVGIAAKIAAETDAALIPPFDDPDIIAGQGTVGLEIAERAQEIGVDLDVVLVPAGGGGLIAGCALALEARAPGAAIYAVEPECYDDHARSLRLGRRQSIADPAARTFCDALRAPTPGKITFQINAPRLAGGLVVSDDEVAAAMALAFRHLKLVLEPGGAVALAATLFGKISCEGKVVAVVASGGNVDSATFSAALVRGEDVCASARLI